MTTTYELYTNENGTPKAVEGKAPAIIERVEALEADIDNVETTIEVLEGGVVKTINGETPDQAGNIDIPVGHNVGEEWVSYTGKIPVGGVPYCGQIVTRATYADLWAYAQAQGLVKTESEWQSWASSHGGNVPYYSSGNGSTTFRMPSIKGYVKGASSQSESGSYIAEGLPNIVGTLTPTTEQSSGVSSSGAFSHTIQTKQSPYYNHKSTSVAVFDFDASRSNPIYGNSDHVTPETSVVLFGVYAFGEVNNVGALDAGTLASALARVESNIPPTPVRYVTEKWSSGTSWYTKYSDGWVEQGGKVTISTTTSTGTRVAMFVEFATKDYQRMVGAVEFPNNTTDYVPIASIASNATIDTLGFSVVRWYSQGASTGIQTPGDVWWEAKGYCKE